MNRDQRIAELRKIQQERYFGTQPVGVTIPEGILSLRESGSAFDHSAAIKDAVQRQEYRDHWGVDSNPHVIPDMVYYGNAKEWSLPAIYALLKGILLP